MRARAAVLAAWWQAIRLSRYGPHLFAAAAALSLLAPVGLYFAHLSREHEGDLHTQAALQATTHARLLEELVERAAAAPRMLPPTLQAATETTRRQVMTDLFRLAGPVSAFELSGVDGRMLRLEPGLGPDEEVLSALPALEPAGPPAFALRGGVPVIEQPLLALVGGALRLWGHAVAYVNPAQLIADGRLADLGPEGFSVRLLQFGEPELGGRLLYAAGERAGSRTATRVVMIPGGGQLRLEVSPARNRLAAVPLVAGAVLLLSAVLSYFLTLRLLRRPAELQREVYRHTRRLREEKLVLEQEIERRTCAERQLEGSHALLDSIFEHLPGMIVLKRADDLRIARINRLGELYLGRPRERLLGCANEEILAPDEAQLLTRGDRDALASSEPVALPLLRLESAGQPPRWLLMRTVLLRDPGGHEKYVLEFGEDVSELEAAERRLAGLNRMLMLLGEINRAIARIGDAETLLEQVGELLRGRGGFPLAWIQLHTGAGLQISAAGADDALVRRVAAALPPWDERGKPAAGMHVLAIDCCGPDAAHELRARQLETLARLPLFAEGRCTGAIVLPLGGVCAVSSEEQHLLEELAANVSFALDALERDGRRRRAEEKLLLAARVFENSAEGIVVTDADNRIVMVNKAFTLVTGYAAEEVIGQNPRLLSSGRQTPAFYRRMWYALQTRGEWHGEIENRRKNGAFYPEWLTISVVRNDAGEVTHHVAVFSDLTARKQIEDRIDFLAHYDALTSLPNRVLFTDRLHQALAKARSDGQHVAVAFLDLDRFQLINETIGHAVGDRLLQEISGRLVGAIRQQDSVSRLGGDEFALIFTGLASADEAVAHIGRVQQILGQPVQVLEHELHCSASIGVAVYPDDGDAADALAKNADSAMYKAMESGGNTVRFFHQDMNQRSAARVKLESKLHYALERGELMVYYQPLVCARSGRIVGAEALLRWQRGDLGGFVSPAAFVPLLEDTGLIVPVGEWVLHTACEENQRWRRLTGEDLFVAVNLSAIQLGDGALPGKVKRMLEAAAFDPRYLEIELTESSVMRDPEAGIRALSELKALGLRISVDDFGTGYSSLSYLKRLPIDTLKVDRSFIHDTPDDREAASLTRAIVAMGHSLNLEIIAEGVEKPAQVAFLRELGCDVLQGFYFSRAVPAERFCELLGSASPYRLPAAPAAVGKQADGACFVPQGCEA